MQVWLPFVVLPAIVVAVVFLFYFFVRHYIERDKSYFGTLLCCAILLVAVAVSILLVPLDVYSVSASEDAPGVSALRHFLRYSYYLAYLLVILSLLVTLPFCYFYYDAWTDYERDRKKRIVQALKYTAFFLVGFAVMVGTAFILKAVQNKDSGEDWQRRIIGELSNWEAFIVFLVAVLTAVGLISYIPYLSYGLSVLPIFLIKGRRNPITEEREHLLAEERELKTAQKTQQSVANERYIQSTSSINSDGSRNPNSTLSKMADKYGYHSKNGTTENNFVRKDHKLRETERRLGENQTKQAALKNETAYWTKCWTLLGPFRIVIGVFFLLLSLLIVTQQTMSVVSRVINSTCGWKCGFSVDKVKSEVPNPMDVLLKLVAPAFPLDLILFTIFIGYLFLVIIYSVSQLGVRIMFWKLASICAKNTPANILIIATALIAFGALSMSSQVIVNVPVYSTFGKQYYYEKPTNNDSSAILLHPERALPSASSILQSLASPQFFARLKTTPDEELTPNDQVADDQKGEQKPCDLEHANLDGYCTATQFASFVQKTNNFLPFFSVIQLGATFVFLLCYLIFTVWALWKKPETDKVWQSDDPDAPNYVE